VETAFHTTELLGTKQSSSHNIIFKGTATDSGTEYRWDLALVAFWKFCICTDIPWNYWL